MACDNQSSSVAHIVHSLLLNRFDQETLVGMMSAYCDASGTEDQPVVAVAGWIGPVARWDTFEVDWKIALARFDVPYLHMKEFAHFKGPFETWKGDEPKRRAFLATLTHVIHSSATMIIGTLVPTDVVREVDREFCVTEHLGNAFTVAALVTILNGQRVFGVDQVEWFFEAGDRGRGPLEDMLERYKHPLPTFRPSRDQKGIRGVVPLQAADFAAYELFRDCKTGEGQPAWRYRMSGIKLFSFKQLLVKYSNSNLLDMCEKLAVPPRNKTDPVTAAPT